MHAHSPEPDPILGHHLLLLPPPPSADRGQEAGRGRSSSPPRKVPGLATAAAAAGPLPPQLQPSTISGGQAILAPPSSCPDLVELNVGGMLFTTSRATLEESQPQSMLAALVSGRHGPPRCDVKVRRGEGGPGEGEGGCTS